MNLLGLAKPWVLDAYCGGGGTSKGLADAGFRVDGVDIVAQPNYPFTFHKGDAVEFIKEHGHKYDAIVTGPVCKWYSKTARIHDADHPQQIPTTRAALVASGKPYVIENVGDAEGDLRDPIMLCGQDFGLHTYRHRLFESNVKLSRPCRHAPHLHTTVKMGRPLQPGDFYHAVGRFSGVAYVRADMGVEWMTRDQIAQCIPPAYAAYIGTQLIRSL
jgi:DNA (cytosine-5)-methyltransferase 1